MSRLKALKRANSHIRYWWYRRSIGSPVSFLAALREGIQRYRFERAQRAADQGGGVMSDLMLFGVLRMPYEMAMSDEISRFQFYGRAQEAANRLELQAARIAELEAALRPFLHPEMRNRPSYQTEMKQWVCHSYSDFRRAAAALGGDDD